MNIIKKLYNKILDRILTDSWYDSLTEVETIYLLEDNPNQDYHLARLRKR